MGVSDDFLNVAISFGDYRRSSIERRLTLPSLIDHLPRCTLATRRKTLSVFKNITSQHFSSSYFKLIPSLLRWAEDSDDRVSGAAKNTVSNILSLSSEKDLTSQIVISLISSLENAAGLEQVLLKIIQTGLRKKSVLDGLSSQDFLPFIEKTDKFDDSLVSVLLLLVPPTKKLPAGFQIQSACESTKFAEELIGPLSKKFSKTQRNSLIFILAAFSEFSSVKFTQDLAKALISASKMEQFSVYSTFVFENMVGVPKGFDHGIQKPLWTQNDVLRKHLNALVREESLQDFEKRQVQKKSCCLFLIQFLHFKIF